MSIKIGLLGFGNIGTGFLNTLEKNRDKITNLINNDISIENILVRNTSNHLGKGFDHILTDSYKKIVANSDIDIVVELIGGINPAYEYVKEALISGKHVVTANKALISTHGEELIKLAQARDVALMFEASVGGGIPLISTINENLVSNDFDKIIGITNGTTNYILTQMYENNLAFDDVLRKAQELGFAEADPTSDIEGFDSVYKLSILCRLAYGLELKDTDIPRIGISNVDTMDIKYAKENE